jgi:hypothetical protein
MAEPTPIPAFAPVLRPDDSAGGVADGNEDCNVLDIGKPDVVGLAVVEVSTRDVFEDRSFKTMNPGDESSADRGS